MIGYEKPTTFTPEVLTCRTLDNYCDHYYLTMLVIYEHLNILAMFCYNLHPVTARRGMSTPHSLVPL